ncbi:winged helix-turn-helix domain-containing protein [Gluconobacter oxydans]|uniref:winged helix-turn-helix domain-containing protein n=1 Tax=Gluconobacter oxydans TaxID=442 RepID=UPI001CD83420
MKCGSLELDPETRVLSGPRGQVRLAPAPFEIVQRLMRRPGTIVSVSDLISTVWPEPDAEPGEPDQALRFHMRVVRGAIAVLGCSRARIRSEPGIGYFMERRD